MTLDKFRIIAQQKCWGSYATSLLHDAGAVSEVRDSFGTYWIEAGHVMREQIADDQLLVRLLRRILCPYTGTSMELYRGENRSRWQNHSIGLAWTSSIETARMFGGGLNAVQSGGVLLKASFKPETIISGPNDHSKYLGEDQYTIDPFFLSDLSVVEFFPPTR
ncbi:MULTISPECIES: hypothetical protein [unclassified Polaromonas]|uniref:hypothetical protein n=1 Tax=unclassified Polaromonas TaxID=2638319 RepID=UPI000BD31807|nr:MULTISPECIES: hypothetical protein [unclassified Polaromonas]OYY33674.1 MAG: hypothetical protein B7Y60_18750 [Polaromonas sp. 35-63-35]OYZ18206.1 MAG: hypothetical protein B7Y28_17225 [Polaromonas sp. 16-63-31]OYZ75857.1 MAG: hypothetical protein B7Y09_22625 [Polaromonas sp. 24-63-21]OZA51280.1 MAG: hypothetical protein B7X88_06565 [Polaromonas sp. 17-63-33]OZA86394.1 MAG: hypothetical protein B7X65_16765 [Polaromonas sp. 39-63-25]